MSNENICGVKLTSGIDIIGDRVADTDKPDFIIMRDTFMVQVLQTPQGIGIAINPIDIFSENADQQNGSSVTIHRSQIMFEPYTPHPNLITRYKQELSGIDLSAAQKPSIIV